MYNGQGDYKDLLYLIQLAKDKVREKFNIELINEVIIITNK
jgi:UDP-N-acetylenolpyruvoylglucosamine reductase